MIVYARVTEPGRYGLWQGGRAADFQVVLIEGIASPAT